MNTDAGKDPVGAHMLDGLTLAEVGQTVSSAAAGAMVRRLGAQVTRIEHDGEGVERHAVTERQRLLDILGRGKSVLSTPSLCSPETFAAAAAADIVIADLADADFWRDPARISQYQRLVGEHNRNVWVTMTPFGMYGPHAGFRGTELTNAAAGGIVRYMRSSLGRPMKPAGFTQSITGGHFGVLAGLHGLLARRERGRPVHFDLSMQDSVVVTGVFLEVAHVMFECAGRAGTGRYGAPKGLVDCADGRFLIVVLEDHQWQGCVRAMDNPAWAEAIRNREDRQTNFDLIQGKLAEWAAARTTRACVERLQGEGVPATPVNSARSLRAGAGLDVRADFFVNVPVGPDGTTQLLPDMPVAPSPHREADPGAIVDFAARSERRFRVVDLTQVLAAPLATSWLGAMGIDVVKVEDPRRMDVYRRNGPFAKAQRHPEASAYFAWANYAKRSHELDLESDEGRQRLAELMASADLVVSNLSGHRATALGATPAALADANTYVISSSGFSQHCKYSSYRCYGHNIHAAGGVVHLSRDRAGEARNLGTSWADPLTSVWIGVMALAQLIKPEAQRQHVDISMVEVVAHSFPEFFAAQSDGGELLSDESRLDHAAPHGVYTCAGQDNWLCVAVESDAEWDRLLDTLGRPAELTRADFATLADRLKFTDELDAAMDSVLSTRDVHDTFLALQRAGVACSPAWDAAALSTDEHLWARELFHRVEHPQWGARALAGLPWRDADTGAVAITRTPLLGEHTSTDPDQWWQG